MSKRTRSEYSGEEINQTAYSEQAVKRTKQHAKVGATFSEQGKRQRRRSHRTTAAPVMASTALTIAIETANREYIERLLNEERTQITINAKDKLNRTPFFYTSKTLDYQVIKLLMDKGAHPNIDSDYLDSVYISYKNIVERYENVFELENNLRAVFKLFHSRGVDISEFISALIPKTWDMSLSYQHLIPLTLFLINEYKYPLELDIDGFEVSLIRYFFQYEQAEDPREYDDEDICQSISFSPLSLTQIERQYGANTGFLKKLLEHGADINNIGDDHEIFYSVFDSLYDSIVECIGTQNSKIIIEECEGDISQASDEYASGEQSSGYWNENTKKPQRYDEESLTQYHCHLEPNRKALNNILNIVFEYAKDIKLDTLEAAFKKAVDCMSNPAEPLRELTLMQTFASRLSAELNIRKTLVSAPAQNNNSDLAARLAMSFLAPPTKSPKSPTSISDCIVQDVATNVIKF
ncbi:MAG: hypothetical protein HKM04_00315 [Legionellales bacterium]|nr:hypothetical protein [Legionellales bacterium]